jgi:hypothetical protein
MGKKLIKQRKETLYEAAFLNSFCGLLFILITIFMGADVRFSTASLPTFLPRLIIELLVSFMAVELLVKADRSTVGFARLITIPLLLAVDLKLGYHIQPIQIAGVILLFGALFLAFHHNPKSKKGVWLAFLSGLLLVITSSLYKYDITHYNSVVAEQAIMLTTVLVFYSFKSKKSPYRLLGKRATGTQSLAAGLSIAIGSYAFAVAPAASIVISIKRAFALLWSINSGHRYFHEKSFGHKMSAAGLICASLVLITAPYMHIPAVVSSIWRGL